MSSDLAFLLDPKILILGIFGLSITQKSSNQDIFSQREL